EHIESVSCRERDLFFQMVISKENLRRKLAPMWAMATHLDGLRWAFENGELVIVQSETKEGENDGFWLGSVDEIGKEVLKLVELDVDGTWRTEPSEIDLNSITQIEILTPYLEFFARHASR
ncbi:MAG: hypothetical protein AAFV29_22490, partial [Myxococcota bacterium]